MTPTLYDSEVIPHAPIIQCVRAFECLCASKWVFCVFPWSDHEILNECKLLLVLKTSLNYIKLQDAHTDTHTLVNSTWLAQVVSILANIIRFWLILSVSFPSISSRFLCPLLPLYLSSFYFMPIVSRSVFPWSLFWFPLHVTFFLLPLICFSYHKQNINTLPSRLFLFPWCIPSLFTPSDFSSVSPNMVLSVLQLQRTRQFMALMLSDPISQEDKGSQHRRCLR